MHKDFVSFMHIFIIKYIKVILYWNKEQLHIKIFVLKRECSIQYIYKHILSSILFLDSPMCVYNTFWLLSLLPSLISLPSLSAPTPSSLPVLFPDSWLPVSFCDPSALTRPFMWPLDWSYPLEPGGVVSGCTTEGNDSLSPWILSVANSSAVRSGAPLTPPPSVPDYWWERIFWRPVQVIHSCY